MRVIVLVACGLVGCYQGAARDQPARLTVGVNTRRFATPVNNDPATAVFRTTTPTPEAVPTETHQAMVASVGFTMPWQSAYFGGEVETGKLDAEGSSASGVYGVAGVGGALGRINLSAELVAGRRWLRFASADEDLGRTVFEPRVRADLWLSPRLSTGVTAGRTLGDQDIWMAGLFLAIHSHDFRP